MPWNANKNHHEIDAEQHQPSSIDRFDMSQARRQQPNAQNIKASSLLPSKPDLDIV